MQYSADTACQKSRLALTSKLGAQDIKFLFGIVNVSLISSFCYIFCNIYMTTNNNKSNNSKISKFSVTEVHSSLHSLFMHGQNENLLNKHSQFMLLKLAPRDIL